MSTEPTDLQLQLAVAPEEADRLLATSGNSLDVVAWLSAHLAVMEHVVYPVARRALPQGKILVGELRVSAQQLLRLLRAMERHYSGDYYSSGLSRSGMLTQLRTLLVARHDLERSLAASLDRALSEGAVAELVASYDASLRRAPTRPHIHFTHPGFLNPVSYLLEQVRDRVLDTMDGRHVPLPSGQALREAGTMG